MLPFRSVRRAGRSSTIRLTKVIRERPICGIGLNYTRLRRLWHNHSIAPSLPHQAAMPVPENYSIVIIGSMNPMLHHPSFYRRVGIITAAEETASLEGNLTCTRQVTQLDIKGVRVMCLPDRYQVATPDAARSDQVVDVASRAMDALPHTPVAVFGINIDRVRHTALPSVPARFAELARTLPLGFRGGADASSAFKYVSNAEVQDARRRVTVVLNPVDDDPHALQVKCNFNYEMHPTTDMFDLGAMIRERFPLDFAESAAAVESTLTALTVH